MFGEDTYLDSFWESQNDHIDEGDCDDDYPYENDPRDPWPDSEPNEDMDGDHASALASAGWGTDEDYGYFEDQHLDGMYED